MLGINCMIVEDEPWAIRILSDYIQKLPNLQLRQVCHNAIEASDFLADNSIDLIFLDIHLPQVKGIDFLRSLQKQPPAVIFTTAYEQYALTGFDLSVTDYLLKPFSFERFLQAVNKASAAIEINKASLKEADYIFVSVHKKQTKVLFNEVLFMESQREYIKIVTTVGEIITKMPMQEMQDKLPEKLFLRIHRSFIIATKKISAYTADTIEIGNYRLPIGRLYKKLVIERVNRYIYKLL